MTYTELKKEYVIENLGKGAKVLLCDFTSRRIIDCDTMTVGAINGFIEKEETKFFKEVASE